MGDDDRANPIRHPWRLLLATAVAGLLTRAGSPTPKDPLGYRIGAYTWWIAVGTVGSAVFAAIAAIAVWIQLGDARRAFENGNRAWIAFVDAAFERSLDDPAGPLIVGHFQNFGRTPALDLKTTMGPVAIRLTKPIGGTRSYPEVLPSWQMIEKIVRLACANAAPMDGANVQWPDPNHQGNLKSPITGQYNIQAIKDGRQLLIVVGCLTYRSFDRARHTGYCQYATQQRDGKGWEFLNCPVGNFAT